MTASLAVPEVERAIQKEFVVVKVDVDRTIGGKDVQKRYGAEKEGLPWFAFLGPDGQPRITSNGPNGNIGCPWRDEEVAYFGEMLRKTAVHLSAQEVDALLKALPSEAREKAAKAAAQT
ncbi:MAG: hypothetical protein EYC70_12980 [Planctomycetota bacterium]|nr:MAG: hypothetical protein EYC70_12980 [Planctomycetota bacterium]